MYGGSATTTRAALCYYVRVFTTKHFSDKLPRVPLISHDRSKYSPFSTKVSHAPQFKSKLHYHVQLLMVVVGALDGFYNLKSFTHAHVVHVYHVH